MLQLSQASEGLKRCCRFRWPGSSKGRAYRPARPSPGAEKEQGRKARGGKGGDLRLAESSLPSHPRPASSEASARDSGRRLYLLSCSFLCSRRAPQSRGCRAAASKLAKVERLPPTGSRREGASARGADRLTDARTLRAHRRRRPPPSRGGFPALLVGGRAGEKPLGEAQRRP